MKKYVLLTLLFILLTCCKNFFYGITYQMNNIKDVNYYLDGIPSHKIDVDNNRYCIFYTDRINNIYFTDYVDNKIQEKNNYNLIISFLKNNDIKLKEEPVFLYDGKTKKDDILELIKQREINNNFQNCDYLIEFLLDYGSGAKKNEKNIWLRIKIDDIKTHDNVGFYSMHENDTIFNRKTQEEKIEKMLSKWWETQIKPQSKVRPLETWCVGNCKNKED